MLENEFSILEIHSLTIFFLPNSDFFAIFCDYFFDVLNTHRTIVPNIATDCPLQKVAIDCPATNCPVAHNPDNNKKISVNPKWLVYFRNVEVCWSRASVPG